MKKGVVIDRSIVGQYELDNRTILRYMIEVDNGDKGEFHSQDETKVPEIGTAVQYEMKHTKHGVRLFPGTKSNFTPNGKDKHTDIMRCATLIEVALIEAGGEFDINRFSTNFRGMLTLYEQHKRPPQQHDPEQ